MFHLIAAQVQQAIATHKAREDFIRTLTADAQAEIRRQDAETARLAEAHKRALELANASRPRNFWGQ